MVGLIKYASYESYSADVKRLCFQKSMVSYSNCGAFAGRGYPSYTRRFFNKQSSNPKKKKKAN
jgi:hypothetical protein